MINLNNVYFLQKTEGSCIILILKERKERQKKTMENRISKNQLIRVLYKNEVIILNQNIKAKDFKVQILMI